MRDAGNVSKSEKILLGLTAVFLCLVLGLYAHDRAAMSAPGTTVETEVSVPPETLTPDFSPLDINTADAAALTALPGIGEALAARIVAYRAEHGAFGAVEDLMEVPGIGQGKFSALADRVTVDGEDTK